VLNVIHSLNMFFSNAK